MCSSDLISLFLEFVARDQLGGDELLNRPMLNPSGAQGAGVIRNYVAGGFTAWRNAYGTDSTPLQELFDSLGSVSKPDDMVNCQDAINGMKSRIWGF